MVPPTHFGTNPETAATNAFQSLNPGDDLASIAMREFEGAVSALTQGGIEVLMLDPPPNAPEAVFPNNWFSTHASGDLFLYSMLAPSRMVERQPDALHALLARSGFQISRVLDLAGEPALEGTGSLVFDHERRIAYMAVSPRSSEATAQRVCETLGYTLCSFRTACEPPVYHTNVVMSVGPNIVLCCFDIICEGDRKGVQNTLSEGGQEVLELTAAQMMEFCGNILEIRGGFAMSERARKGLRAGQLKAIEQNGSIFAAKIDTIERVAGGSMRCMLAEVFLPRVSRET
jgi:hypothetical protein